MFETKRRSWCEAWTIPGNCLVCGLPVSKHLCVVARYSRWLRAYGKVVCTTTLAGGLLHLTHESTPEKRQTNPARRLLSSTLSVMKRWNLERITTFYGCGFMLGV